MLRTLVLDGTYQPISVFPLHTITWQAAVTRVLNGTCSIVSEYDELILTPTLEMRKPAVVVRRDKIEAWEREIGVSAEAILFRDGCQCQYCGVQLTKDTVTLDHVVPESKGGKRSFDNLVAACQSCNESKGAADPVGVWEPRRKPYVPSKWDLLRERRRHPIVVDHPSWVPHLGNWQGEVLLKNEMDRCA